MSGLELGNSVPGAVLIFALIVIVCFIAVDARRLLAASRRRGFRAPSFPFKNDHDQGFDLTDVGQQLRAVMAAQFQKQRALSHSEYRVFKIVEDEVAALRRGHRVFAQTSLGEILRSPDQNAFHSINSKRVDVLVVDGGGWPILVVEYQGNGHYQGTAAARDAVKKEALRKAQVRYLEIDAADSDDYTRSRVREQLGRETTAPANAQSCARPNALPAL